MKLPRLGLLATVLVATLVFMACGLSHSKWADIHYSNGYGFSKQGLYEQAIKEYDKAIELNPTIAKTYVNRAAAYLQLGQFQQAIQDSDKAIQLDPAQALGYANRGRAYLELGQLQQAIQDLDKAIELAPTQSGAYYIRGIALQGFGAA